MDSSSNPVLTGTQVKLWPYVRGYYPRDVLYGLWSAIEQAGDGARVFWGNSDPAPLRMDLPSFCEFVTKEGRTLILLTNLDGTAMLGCAWFEDVFPKRRAFGSIYLVPESRGKVAVEAVRLVTDYACQVLDVNEIWAVTPWREAGQLICAAGYQRVATLPGFAWVDEQSQDVGVYKKVRATHG